jgi:small-conductance mechanosensitive channel
LKDQVVNYTPAAKKGRLGFSTSITIGYDVDWRTVNELLLKAAKETPALSSDPPPFVFQSGLDDFYASYTIRVYTSGPPPLGKIQTALRQNILDVFHQAGVEIRTPVFEASMKTNQRVFPKEPNRKAGSD